MTDRHVPRLGYRRYKDRRTWRSRIENMDARWKELMPVIVQSYLHWKYGAAEPPSQPRRSSPEASRGPPDSHRQSNTEPAVPPDPLGDRAESFTRASDPAPADTVPVASEYDLEVECIDFFNPRDIITVPRTSHQLPTEALVRSGFLGATPDKPTIAVSIETLQLFYDIRRFKASYSVEAFTKMICYKYVVSLSELTTVAYIHVPP